ncbi:MAG: hypothetical protein EAZ74_04500 [Alphaproteobacteria bacterium]|nr:MAG: hypothetical protein EAY76_00805 [Alphaproteobacteria bacterium]TAF14215.1 MAG: hypothetical protein EAZ74_04500 [Alphaproteobacteria bacterium]TAF76924.1 MAG: hypothetical protein EAZ52_02045 [Alphaproteobacteria bacterium]
MSSDVSLPDGLNFGDLGRMSAQDPEGFAKVFDSLTSEQKALLGSHNAEFWDARKAQDLASAVHETVSHVGDVSPVIDVDAVTLGSVPLDSTPLLPPTELPVVPDMAAMPHPAASAAAGAEAGMEAVLSPEGGGALVKTQPTAVGRHGYASTVAGVGEAGVGAAFIYSGLKDLQQKDKEQPITGAQRLKGTAKVALGAGIAADGTLRATTGKGWVERVAEAAATTVRHVR